MAGGQVAAKVHDHGIVVGLFDRFQRGDEALARRGVGFRILDHVLADDALEGKDHVVGRHLDAVVELDPLAQFDLQGHVVQPVQLLGQFQVHAAGGVAGDQAVEHVADHRL